MVIHNKRFRKKFRRIGKYYGELERRMRLTTPMILSSSPLSGSDFIESAFYPIIYQANNKKPLTMKFVRSIK